MILDLRLTNCTLFLNSWILCVLLVLICLLILLFTPCKIECACKIVVREDSGLSMDYVLVCGVH